MRERLVSAHLHLVRLSEHNDGREREGLACVKLHNHVINDYEPAVYSPRPRKKNKTSQDIKVLHQLQQKNKNRNVAAILQSMEKPIFW